MCTCVGGYVSHIRKVHVSCMHVCMYACECVSVCLYIINNWVAGGGGLDRCLCS